MPVLSAVTCVALHPDGRRAATGSADGVLRLWDPEAVRCLSAIDAHAGQITAVTIDPGAGQILSAGADKTTKAWDLTSGACLRTLWSHFKPFCISARTGSTNGVQVASRSFDYRTLKIWSLEGPRSPETLIHGHAGFLCFAFLPDGLVGVSGGWEGSMTLWDLSTGARLDHRTAHSAEITRVAIQGDGLRAVAADADGGLMIWDLSKGTVQRLPDAHRGRVTSLAVVGDERPLAITGGADERVRGWDLLTLSCMTEWRTTRPVTACALGRSDARPAELGYRAPALGPCRTLVAIGDEVGNMNFFEWAPEARGAGAGLSGSIQ
jgi:WD40 repeat protein